MTLAQLTDEVRKAYDSRDRERLEWALKQIEALLNAKDSH
jgi:hypothetical protein